jgi:hypothetical protein
MKGDTDIPTRKLNYSRANCVLATVGFKRIKREKLLELFVCFAHLLVRAVEIDPGHDIPDNLERILDVFIESRQESNS